MSYRFLYTLMFKEFFRALFCLLAVLMEDGMSMTTFYYYSVKSSIWFTDKHIFKIIIYFFNTSKCAANYIISFEVYCGFIGQKISKLWRQEIWSANIMRIRSWTFRLPWNMYKYKFPKRFELFWCKCQMTLHQKCLYFSEN